MTGYLMVTRELDFSVRMRLIRSREPLARIVS